MEPAELGKPPWKSYRAKVFLSLIVLLYFWDIALFLGIRDPAQLPHPFAWFRFWDIVWLRGFDAMLRELIFYFVSGGALGIALGAAILYSPSLANGALPVLRIVQWLPFIAAYIVFAPLLWGVMTAMLCTAYHYPAARSTLNLQRTEALNWAAREALLNTLLFCLISQIWVEHWRWFFFGFVYSTPSLLWKIFAVLAACVALIRWSLPATFTATAAASAELQERDIRFEKRSSEHPQDYFSAEEFFILLTLSFIGGWGSGLWADTWLSLLEILAGIALAGFVAMPLAALSTIQKLKTPLCSLVSLAHVSALALWLLFLELKLPGALHFWHKVFAVGCLTLACCFQSFWASRARPTVLRVFLMTEAALPLAFVAMMFGEAMAATQGLGFSMIIGMATGRTDQAVLAFVITIALLMSFLFCSRILSRRLSPLAEPAVSADPKA